LQNLGFRTYVFDGDNVRYGLSSSFTFSDDYRKENIRRIGEVPVFKVVDFLKFKDV
tara:strand:+ start:306 stop:473 length:168 start_codon:yes stop_codon:yes gene_type:complete